MKKKKKTTGNVIAKRQKLVDSMFSKMEGSLNKVNKEHENLAVGVALHTKFKKTATSYLQEVADYTDTTLAKREDVIDLSRLLRDREGICSTVSDLLADLAINEGRFECDSDDLKALLMFWYDNVNNISKNNKVFISKTPGLVPFMRGCFIDWLTDGDCVFGEYIENNIPIRGMKKSFALPVTLRCYDVTELETDSELAKFGFDVLSLSIDQKLKKMFENPKTDEEKQLVKMLPKDWKKQTKEGLIRLNPLTTHHISRNPKDYGTWGVPYFRKAFVDIAAKRRLQALDATTIAGLINRLTIITIGLADETRNKYYHVPSPGRVGSLVSMLTDPKASNMMVWPGPDLAFIDIGPDGKILETSDRYRQCDTDILRSLHVPPLLIDGSSSGASVRDWAVLLSTNVGLDVFRKMMEKEITIIANKIAELNGFKNDIVNFRFKKLIMRDDAAYKNFINRVYELGGISLETYVEELGFNWETELKRKQDESNKGYDVLFFNRTLPYQGRPEPNVPKTKKDKVKNSLGSIGLVVQDFKNQLNEILNNKDIKKDTLFEVITSHFLVISSVVIKLFGSDNAKLASELTQEIDRVEKSLKKEITGTLIRGELDEETVDIFEVKLCTEIDKLCVFIENLINES